MPSQLTAERVRRDLEVLSRAGLDIDTFLAEADASLVRALPHAAACVLVVDPTTQLATLTFKYGELEGDSDNDADWCKVEYYGGDATSFLDLFRGEQSATAMNLHTSGDISRSVRMREFMAPRYGFSDELRIVARTGGKVWGGLCLHRDNPASPYTEDEVAFAASISDYLAAGLRIGLLARSTASSSTLDGKGPAVIIIDRDDEVVQRSVGADDWLAELAAADNSSGPVNTLAALVAGARAYASGKTTHLPRCRVRVRSGRWLLGYASPLAGPGGDADLVVVTIEEARPPEIVPLVVAAFDLTPRERDVTQMVLQGIDTKEIAMALHLSAYTVQDHLKSVFEKAAVRSRRELIARIFFDQYVPRLGSELASNGWFAESAVAAT